MMKNKALVAHRLRMLLLMVRALLVLTLVGGAIGFPPPASATRQSQGLMPGDANGDGRCTEVDALTALQMAAGMIPPDPMMDVDGDGEVTEVDALTILQWAAAGGQCQAGEKGLRPEQTAPPSPPQEVEVISQRELSTQEFLQLVEGDERFADVYAFASEQGYTQPGTAEEVTLSDDTVVSGLALGSSEGENAVALRIITSEGVGSILVRFEQDRFVLFNREGRAEIGEDGVSIFNAEGHLIGQTEFRQASQPLGVASTRVQMGFRAWLIPSGNRSGWPQLAPCALVLTGALGPFSRFQDGPALAALGVSEPGKGCYKTPGYWEEYDKCMGGLGLAVPAGCVATFKYFVLPVCVVGGALTWGAACAAVFIPWAIVCAQVAKCALYAFDNPPTVKRVLVEHDQSAKPCLRPEQRGGQRGILKVPKYKVTVVAEDDREPFDPKVTRAICGGERIQVLIEDCAGYVTPVEVIAPAGSGKSWYARSWLMGFSSSPPPAHQQLLYDSVEIYGPSVVTQPEWVPCGKDGQVCCLDAPTCDEPLMCNKDDKCAAPAPTPTSTQTPTPTDMPTDTPTPTPTDTPTPTPTPTDTPTPTPTPTDMPTPTPTRTPYTVGIFTARPIPGDPGPEEAYKVHVSISPPKAGVLINITVSGTDDFAWENSGTTDDNGVVVFGPIPGGEAKIKDTIVVKAPELGEEASFTFEF